MLREQKSKTTKKALIYCRVSSEKQVKEGHGLDSQEKRCREYAENKGYFVEKVFRDEAISGGDFDRPAMMSLFAHVDAHPFNEYLVIIDDLSRLARDLGVHIALKNEFEKRDVSIECLNFNFDDSPEGKYIENIMASTNEYHKNSNRRQVMQKQKARLELGYWTFCNPPALKYIKHPIHGKLLVKNEPIASIFKQAIEMYANDILNTYDQVRDFVREQYKTNNIKRPFGRNGAIKMLSNPLYCGLVEYLPWEVELRQGHHEGFISKETFDHVQDKMRGKSKKRIRADYSLDFSLRGFATCPECGNFYTASWNKGRSQRYPNYWCKTPNCSRRYKAIRKKDIDADFLKLLHKSKPKTEVLDLTQEIMNRCWKNRIETQYSYNKARHEELKKLNKSIEVHMESIERTQKPELIRAYEDRLVKLIEKRDLLQNETDERRLTSKKLGTATDKVFNAIKNPLHLWKSDQIEDKRTIMYMYFESNLPYHHENGFGTATFSDGYSILKSLEDPKSNLVEMAGIEPAS